MSVAVMVEASEVGSAVTVIAKIVGNMKNGTASRR